MKPLVQIINKGDQTVWNKTINLKRNQLLLAAGETEKYIKYVAQEGLIAAILINEEEHCIRFGYSGSFITALDSFITGKPSQYSIRAIRKVS